MITTYLDQFSERRVAVIGDVMLDCYMSGDVSRISPEAPVPVLRVLSETAVPGGAANVAVNLASLGLNVALVGLVGDDLTRDDLIGALAKWERIDRSGLITRSGRRTTRKLRIIGARQQMVRVDHEDSAPCDARDEAALIHQAKQAIDSSDAVILSDYGKGACSDAVLQAVIAHAAVAGKPLLIDPKRTDFSAYRGAALLTPNRKELFEATRLPCETDEEATLAAARAQELCGVDILLTRSEKGMSYFPVHGEPEHLPTQALDVFDVSGAGDTVVAVLAASKAVGMPMRDGIRLANHAAAIVVSKVGTACVSSEELIASLLTDQPPVSDGAVVDRETAIELRAAWTREKLRVGFTNGCFDLLHPGHIALLREAAQSCDRLIVALNSDASVRRLKGPTRPVQSEAARAAVMGAIKGVAAVTIFDEQTPLELITALRPDVLIKGADYALADVVGADIVQGRGGQVLLVDIKPGHSTTALIAASTTPATRELGAST